MYQWNTIVTINIIKLRDHLIKVWQSETWYTKEYQTGRIHGIDDFCNLLSKEIDLMQKEAVTSTTVKELSDDSKKEA